MECHSSAARVVTIVSEIFEKRYVKLPGWVPVAMAGLHAWAMG
jgi:hypothetical protein